MPSPTQLFSTITLTALLAACKPFALLESPPTFPRTPEWFAVDNGNNVPFSVYIFSVASKLESVTCANGVIVLEEDISEWQPSSASDVDNIRQPFLSAKWSGVAPYSDLPHKSGRNEITCKATNSYGSVEKVAAIIEYIPNVPPQPILLTTDILLCGNDGGVVYDIPLLDPSSTYLRGAEYTLQGALDSGLKVRRGLSNVSGQPLSGNRQWNNLRLRVTTAAGSAVTEPFSITVTDATCL